MKRLLKRLYFKIKYRCKNVVIKQRVNLYANTVFEGNNYVGENSIFGGFLGIGSYCGSDCVIKGKIGRYTCIANKVCVVQGTHPTRDFVSIHPAFFSKVGKCGINFVSKKMFEELKYVDSLENYTVIGNDVWIGYRATILAGVSIGDGAIIGANSMVIKDVPPYAIVAGNPATIIRYRFKEEQINRLETAKWWNCTVEQIKCVIEENNDIIKDVDAFLDKIQEITNLS